MVLTSTRMDKLLKQKIDAAAKRENLSTSAFIRQTLEEKSDQILVGKNTQERDPILIEILDRISYIQADLKHDTQGIKKPSTETYDEYLKEIAKEVSDKYRDE